jgi:hypothetical protein
MVRKEERYRGEGNRTGERNVSAETPTHPPLPEGLTPLPLDAFQGSWAWICTLSGLLGLGSASLIRFPALTVPLPGIVSPFINARPKHGIFSPAGKWSGKPGALNHWIRTYTHEISTLDLRLPETAIFVAKRLHRPEMCDKKATLFRDCGFISTAKLRANRPELLGSEA